MEVTVAQVHEAVAKVLPGTQTPFAAGGGGGGQYQLASVAELDALIAQWQVIHDKIDSTGQKLRQARDLIEPPAADEMSRKEAQATVHSLNQARDHNVAMRKYATAYIDKLVAARQAYENTEQHNAAALRLTGGG
ncbi:hypothetical protein [Actinokineospora sp. NBRC 105648]|uniref:hypothetical protein n=1 Tax=Actinokineospora sp. NBRC 105648 TaxID=3032206 RepID=UPI0025535172|nr:hypothetical protein [Actinokineospora sp. NBRC 105648]